MNYFLLPLINQIDNDNLSLYLVLSNWKKIRTKIKLNYDVYINTKGDERFQINVPIFKDYFGYEEMITNACYKIAQFENIDVNLVVEKILNPRADIIKIRTVSKNVINGTIPLEDASSLIEKARRILMDSAMDVLNKTKHRVSKYSNEVNSFISKCRFGQTQVGSYVLSIICPFKDEIQNEEISLFGDEFKEENETRRIVKKLIKSTNQINAALENNVDLLSFIEKNDDDFISLNFIEDLSEFGNFDEESLLEINTEFSPLEKEQTKFKANFNGSKTHILKTFIEQYKAKENISDENIYIIGLISKVAADPILDKREFGEITVQSKLDDKLYKVTVPLRDYPRALEAHQKGLLVRVSGKVDEGKIVCGEFTVLENYLF